MGPTKKPRIPPQLQVAAAGPSTPRTPREAHKHRPDTIPTPTLLPMCLHGCCFCTRGCVVGSGIPGVPHAPQRHRPALRSWGTGGVGNRTRTGSHSPCSQGAERDHIIMWVLVSIAHYNVLRYVNSLHYCGTLLHVGMYFTGYVTKALHGHLLPSIKSHLQQDQWLWLIVKSFMMIIWETQTGRS